MLVSPQYYPGARFARHVSFKGVIFAEKAQFAGASFAHSADFSEIGEDAARRIQLDDAYADSTDVKFNGLPGWALEPCEDGRGRLTRVNDR